MPRSLCLEQKWNKLLIRVFPLCMQKIVWELDYVMMGRGVGSKCHRYLKENGLKIPTKGCCLSHKILLWNALQEKWKEMNRGEIRVWFHLFLAAYKSNTSVEALVKWQVTCTGTYTFSAWPWWLSSVVEQQSVPSAPRRHQGHGNGTKLHRRIILHDIIAVKS